MVLGSSSTGFCNVCTFSPSWWVETLEHLLCLACDHVRRKKRLWAGVSVHWSPAIQASISGIVQTQDHSFFFFFFFFLLESEKGSRCGRNSSPGYHYFWTNQPFWWMISNLNLNWCSSVLLASCSGFFFKDTMWENTCPYKLFSSADILESISMSYCFPLFYVAVSITFDLVFHTYVFVFYVPSHSQICRGLRRAAERSAVQSMGSELFT